MLCSASLKSLNVIQELTSMSLNYFAGLENSNIWWDCVPKWHRFPCVAQAPSPVLSSTVRLIYWVEERMALFVCGAPRNGSVWNPSKLTSKLKRRTCKRHRKRIILIDKHIAIIIVTWCQSNVFTFLFSPEAMSRHCPSIHLGNLHFLLGQIRHLGNLSSRESVWQQIQYELCIDMNCCTYVFCFLERGISLTEDQPLSKT